MLFGPLPLPPWKMQPKEVSSSIAPPISWVISRGCGSRGDEISTAVQGVISVTLRADRSDKKSLTDTSDTVIALFSART